MKKGKVLQKTILWISSVLMLLGLSVVPVAQALEVPDLTKYVRPLTPYDIFTANIEAGNQEQLIIKELVESYGLSITPGDAPGGICAVATIQDIMKKFGYGNLDHTLRLCIATWEGAPHSLSSNILKSIAILIHVYGDELSDETFKEKLGSVSLKEIMRNAKERRSRIVTSFICL